MDVLKDWLEKSFANTESKKVQFDITEKTLSVRLFSYLLLTLNGTIKTCHVEHTVILFQPSFLILESLVYICARKHREQSLQSELLNVGILQWIVSKSIATN